MDKDSPKETRSYRYKMRLLKTLIMIAKGVYAVARLIDRLINQP